MGGRVVFVASPGRVGTQWLARILSMCPGVEVEHEPIGAAWLSRRWYRAPVPHPLTARVRRHLDRIDAAVASGRTYIETGWPSYGALPLLADRYEERFQVIHLVRHPVPNALSLLSHRLYHGSTRPDRFVADAVLAGTDPGVRYADDATTWAARSAFERCLFTWKEVNRYALDLSALGGSPMPVLHFERLFEAGELDEVLERLELTRPTLAPGHVDRWPRRLTEPAAWEAAVADDELRALAIELGYEIEAVDAEALRERYLRRGTRPSASHDLLQRIVRGFRYERAVGDGGPGTRRARRS